MTAIENTNRPFREAVLQIFQRLPGHHKRHLSRPSRGESELEQRFFRSRFARFRCPPRRGAQDVYSLDPAMGSGARSAILCGESGSRRYTFWRTAIRPRALGQSRAASADASLGRGPCERDFGPKSSRCRLRPWRQCRMFCGSRRARHGVRFRGDAVQWAKQRFPETKVTYAQGDLFALPDAWRQNFDLVHECYTLQALSSELIPQALAALKSALTPGGELLVIARARDEAEATNGPPWPLPPSVFDEAKRQGLTALSIEDIPAIPGGASRHWCALLRRAEDV